MKSCLGFVTLGGIANSYHYDQDRERYNHREDIDDAVHELVSIFVRIAQCGDTLSGTSSQYFC